MRRSLARERIYDRNRSKARGPTVKAWWRRNVARALLYAAKRRAKLRGILFSLTPDDVLIPNVCPIDGLPLESGIGKAHGRTSPRAPSLDRRVPSEGYVKSNIAVISHLWNVRKNDMTVADVKTLLRYMEGPTGETFPEHCALSFGS